MFGTSGNAEPLTGTGFGLGQLGYAVHQIQTPATALRETEPARVTALRLYFGNPFVRHVPPKYRRQNIFYSGIARSRIGCKGK